MRRNERSSAEDIQINTSPLADETNPLTWVDRVHDRPEMLLTLLLPRLAITDRMLVDEIAIRNMLTDAYPEFLQDSAYGLIDDILALLQPWGFDLSAIKVPVPMRHQKDELVAPVEHTLWLAKHIPTSIVEVDSGTSPLGAPDILPRALAWIKGTRSEGRASRISVDSNFSA